MEVITLHICCVSPENSCTQWYSNNKKEHCQEIMNNFMLYIMYLDPISEVYATAIGKPFIWSSSIPKGHPILFNAQDSRYTRFLEVCM